MVRATIGRFWIRVWGALALLLLWPAGVCSAQAFPKMDSSWRVFAGGQSFAVRMDGSFVLSNLSALDRFGPSGPGSAPDGISDEFLRVVGVRAVGGVTSYAYSELFRLEQGKEYNVGELTLTSTTPPFAQTISAAPDDLVLTSALTSTQVRVTGERLDGSLVDVSGSAQGTSYGSSDARVLTVDSEGLTTAVGDGVAYVTVRHEGCTAVLRLTVALDDPLTQVIGFAQVADGSPVVGVTLAITGQGLSTTTASDGRFVFDNVATSLGPIRVGTPPTMGPVGVKGTSKPISPAPGDLTDAGILVLTPVFVSPQLGMVADNFSRSVTVFETAGNTVLGTVQLPSVVRDPMVVFPVGDCSITRDGTTGFVTDFFKRVWVIDLTATPPALASGINPIMISTNGEDTTITPNNRFLVVTDGDSSQPVSVVDIASRTEISTYLVPGGTNSVDACADGSLLVTSASGESVTRLTIDKFGKVSGTPKFLSTGVEPNNAVCAPSAAVGVMVQRVPPNLVSFAIPSFQVVDTQPMFGGLGLCAVFAPFGNRLYVRSTNNDFDGFIEAFDYNSATGAMGNTPVFSIGIPDSDPDYTFYGIDTLAVDPTGTRIYASSGDQVEIFSATDGSPLGSIALPPGTLATGIAIR